MSDPAMKGSIVAAALALAGLAALADEGHFGGGILYGGHGIRSLGLSDGVRVEIVNWPSLFVDDLSRIDARRLLISVDVRDPTQHGNRSGDWVAIYDMPSKELEFLVKGSRPAYLRERQMMAYYQAKHLRLADLSGRLVRIVDTDGSAYPRPRSIVPVSETEFLYGSWHGNTYGVWRYDLDTGESERMLGLRDCSLSNAMWRSATRELLCSERLPGGSVTGKRFLTDLGGGTRRWVEFGAGRLWSGRFWPVAYMEDIDAMLIQESTANLWSGEYYPIHVHRFSDGLEVKVAENAPVGGAVYEPPGDLPEEE